MAYMTGTDRWATRRVLTSALALMLTASLTVSRPARADATPTQEVASRPNRAMVVVGVLALVGSYTPAALVASKSPIYSDSSLYVPVLGPWLDLADRPKCGPGSVRCRVETGNETLLVVDGVFQAWGLVATVVGLFAKEYVQSRPAAATAAFQLAPARLGPGGYGVGAFGTF